MLKRENSSESQTTVGTYSSPYSSHNTPTNDHTSDSNNRSSNNTTASYSSPMASSSTYVLDSSNSIQLTIFIEDYQSFNSARTYSSYFPQTSTVDDVIQKLKRKWDIREESNPSVIGPVPTEVGLFFQGKDKQLKPERPLRHYVKSGDTLVLKKVKTKMIRLHFYIEDYKELNCAMTVAHDFPVVPSLTISDLIHVIANKPSVQIPQEKIEDIALFLPTKKSKKGLFLERSKDLVTLDFADKSTLLLKIRKKEEALLAIEIENYEQLSCARTVTSYFNLNMTVEEVLQKIARKSNVFISDVDRFHLLLPDRTKMKRTATLKHYNLKERDCLLLVKSSLVSDFFETDEKVMILCERTKEHNKEVLQFDSLEHESLYWDLSLDEMQIHQLDLTEIAATPEDDVGIEMTGEKKTSPGNTRSKFDVQERSDQQARQIAMIKKQSDKNLRSPAHTQSVFSYPVDSEHSGSPKLMPFSNSPSMKDTNDLQKIKARKPGQLPKKTPSHDDSLSLLCIYHSERRFYTIAISRLCSAGDLVKNFRDRLKTDVSIWITENREGEVFHIHKLGEHDKIIDEKEKWGIVSHGSSSRHRFTLKLDSGNPSDIFSAPPRKDSVTREFNVDELGRQVIPSNIRHSLEIKQWLKQSDAPGQALSLSAFKPKASNSLPTAIIIGAPGTPNQIDISNLSNPEVHWIDPSEIKKDKKISKGAFAKVYKGIYNNKTVAVKTLKGNVTAQQVAAFKVELEIMSSVKSDFLVHFYGACVDMDRLSLVMEFCENRSLYDVMQSDSEDHNKLFTWPQILKWMHQMILGIGALHQWDPPLVHRDIKSLNLLLDDSWNLKVCDFGLSRFRIMTNAQTLGEVRGTMAYCPPEIYEGQLFSPKSDIYSIGMVMWELVTKLLRKKYLRPFEEFSDITFDFQIIIQTSKNKLRPTIPAECPELVAQLIQNCWDQDPDKRPSCPAIDLQLKVLEEDCKAFPVAQQPPPNQ